MKNSSDITKWKGNQKLIYMPAGSQVDLNIENNNSLYLNE